MIDKRHRMAKQRRKRRGVKFKQISNLECKSPIKGGTGNLPVLLVIWVGYLRAFAKL
jgi:hypothetical protein